MNTLERVEPMSRDEIRDEIWDAMMNRQGIYTSLTDLADVALERLESVGLRPMARGVLEMSTDVENTREKLPICERLRQHGHWADLMRAGDDGAAIIEALVEAVETLMRAADHAGGLGGCDPELEAACRVGAAALSRARNGGTHDKQ